MTNTKEQSAIEESAGEYIGVPFLVYEYFDKNNSKVWVKQMRWFNKGENQQQLLKKFQKDYMGCFKTRNVRIVVYKCKVVNVDDKIATCKLKNDGGEMEAA